MGLAHASWTFGKQHIDPHCETQPCNTWNSFFHMDIIYLIMNWKPNSLWTLKCPSQASHCDRVQMPFFLYTSCIQCHWDTLTSPEQQLSPQGQFISFIKSRHKPQGWFLAEVVESFSSTFHTHTLLTALHRFLINPSSCTNWDCKTVIHSPGSSDTHRRIGELLWKLKETEPVWEEQAGCREASLPWVVG